MFSEWRIIISVELSYGVDGILHNIGIGIIYRVHVIPIQLTCTLCTL